MNRSLSHLLRSSTASALRRQAARREPHRLALERLWPRRFRRLLRELPEKQHGLNHGVDLFVTEPAAKIVEVGVGEAVPVLHDLRDDLFAGAVIGDVVGYSMRRTTCSTSSRSGAGK